jgi:hypothetical protein
MPVPGLNPHEILVIVRAKKTSWFISLESRDDPGER